MKILVANTPDGWVAQYTDEAGNVRHLTYHPDRYYPRWCLWDKVTDRHITRHPDPWTLIPLTTKVQCEISTAR